MSRRPVPVKGEQFRKLFIGGITFNTTEQDLRDFYGQFGEIVDAVVMVHKGTNKSRGFGFVTFSDPSMVDKAQAARPHRIHDREVETKRATPREESNTPEAHQTAKKMFVANIKREHTEEQLHEYFSQFGAIEKVEIIKNSHGEPRGFAFVTFEDYDTVDKCILHKPHHIGAHRCDVKKAVSKEQMKKIDSGPPPPSRRPPPPSYGGRGGYGHSGYGDPYGPPPPHHGYNHDPYYGSGGYERYPPPAEPVQGGYGSGGDQWGYDYGSYDAGYGTGEQDPRGYYDNKWNTGYEAGKYEEQGYSGGPSRGGGPSSRGYPPQDPYARPAPPSSGPGYGRESGPAGRGGYGAR